MTKFFDFVDTSKIQLNELLSITGYTNEFVLRKLYENNEKFVKLLGNGKISKISAYDISEGQGYCSRVFKTTLYWDKEDETQTYTFIMKIPTSEAWNHLNLDFSETEKENNKATIGRMHNVESDAYDLMKDLHNFPKPEIYYIERAAPGVSGMIMMEDLSGCGVSPGIFFSVTEQHCFNVAKHVAELQAYIDFLPDKSWKTRFSENLHAKPDIEDIWKKTIIPIGDDEDLELAKKAKFLLKLDALELGKYCTETRAKEIGCETFSHGDLWTNNMLIALNPDGSVSNKIRSIIDWQVVYCGNPLFDIARFISNCSDAEIRRECEYKVVDAYYDVLTQKYKERGEKVRFTREEAYELYELGTIQQLLTIAIMLALTGLPLKQSTNKSDHAKYRKLALRLHLLYDDAIVLMEKHGMKDKFLL